MSLPSIISAITNENYILITTLAALAAIFMFIEFIYEWVKNVTLKIIKTKLENHQHQTPEYNLDYSAAISAQKNYIPMRFQDKDPCNLEEPIDNFKDISCTPVYFKMNMLFSGKNNFHYFLILADSGMGKTTFLCHILFSYYKRLFTRYEIKFIPLFLDEVFNEINAIKNPEKVILLLDGLNENIEAQKNPNKYFKKLIIATLKFHKVIITCRTQFFDSESKEPSNNYYKINSHGKIILLQKKYISPLKCKEIQTYCDKKYFCHNITNNKNYEYLKTLIQKTPKLIIRPMLLAHVENIAKNKKKKCTYVHEIYYEIIMQWLRDESANTTDENIRYLYEFHQTLAREMYNANSAHITKTKIKDMCQLMKPSIKWHDIKNKSLLNRNNIGNYKFSHKSIWEYFIAANAFSDLDFRKRFVKNNSGNYLAAHSFLKEMSEKVLDEYLHNPYIPLTDKPLSYMLFSDVNLSECNLDHMDFERSDFSNACLHNCNFSNSNLKGVNLENASLDGCVLNKACLNGALFLETDIPKIRYTLMDADFSYLIIVNNNSTKKVPREKILVCSQL